MLREDAIVLSEKRFDWLLIIAGAGTLIAMASEAVGLRTVKLGPGELVFFPFIWAIILGAVIGLQKIRPVNRTTQFNAVRFMEIGIVLFISDLGALIGPSLVKIAHLGLPLFLQEFGHAFGTVIIALPIAVLLGLGRTAIGATYSIDREPNLAFMAERYGGGSDEYRGALSVYVFGSIIGAIYIALLAAYLASAQVFSPEALAMGAGVGSGSMMAAGVAALAHVVPKQSKTLLALGAASNLITEVIGVYITIFITLPFAERLYRFWSRTFGKGETHIATAGQLAAPEAGEALPAPNRMGFPTLLGLMALVGVIMLISNTVGTGMISGATILGMAILCGFTVIAFQLSRVLPQIPAVFWASVIPLLLTAKFSPISVPLDHLFKGINFLAMVTPVLAFVGISIGKDIKALRASGWKFLVISLIVYTASYVTAAAIAQFAIL